MPISRTNGISVWLYPNSDPRCSNFPPVLPCNMCDSSNLAHISPPKRGVYFSFWSHSQQGLNMEGIIHFSCFRLSPSLVQLPGRKYMQYPEIFLSSYGPVMTVPETSGFSPADVFADTRRAQGHLGNVEGNSIRYEKF
ncbi:predicted protein [Histoplasma capsulatum G186AR]|uniref:Uncharacterized protein n=1 Tax=Ajellomyces capsulatus (strain G186AR / H82 / ATCC MYA-2454 / RMSCC 2432) TaxID=447093 RepID=C0NLK6_AJECG|nr:uncharacterized protein HCBG_04386 [Histoplasma capsulatum G186AR]EEH07507.1 predicted protein [Histoplasma capsulatum G186AR]